MKKSNKRRFFLNLETILKEFMLDKRIQHITLEGKNYTADELVDAIKLDFFEKTVERARETVEKEARSAARKRQRSIKL